MKIIGNTVGTPLPKPNLMQTDPSKGDYVKGKEEFAEQLGGGGSGGNVDLSGYAKTEDIPTKLSEMENDSGYQTADQVTAIVQAQLGVIENGTY